MDVCVLIIDSHGLDLDIETYWFGAFGGVEHNISDCLELGDFDGEIALLLAEGTHLGIQMCVESDIYVGSVDAEGLGVDDLKDVGLPLNIYLLVDIGQI